MSTSDCGVFVQVAAFYSWQPPVSGATLVNLINTQLQQQWAATAAATTANPSVSSNKLTAGTAAAGANGSSAQAQDDAAVSVQPDQVPPVCPLRVWHAEQMPRQFHPTFAAKWRRYVYLLPLRMPHTAGGSAHARLSTSAWAAMEVGVAWKLAVDLPGVAQ